MTDDKKKEPVDERKLEELLRVIFDKPKPKKEEKKDGGQNSNTRDADR